MATIEGRDGADVQALRGSDDGCIDRAEREVAILCNELKNPGPIGLRNCLDLEVSIDDISKKANLGMYPDPFGQEKGDLGNHKRRNCQRTTLAAEE